MHDAEVVHRSVEPSVVLVWPCGRFALSDFNLAVHVGEHEEVSRMCGRVPYIPPEVLQGCEADCGVKIDMFAFGVLLFIALSGAEPEDCKEFRFDLLSRHLKGISVTCMELVSMTTRCDPKRRPHASDALCCNWLGGFHQPVPEGNGLPNVEPIVSRRRRHADSSKTFLRTKTLPPGFSGAGSALDAVREMKREVHVGACDAIQTPQPPRVVRTRSINKVRRARTVGQ
eukprot:TRINITY_DN55234_c0_g1_i1.p1 TRINITY_DN55234_c0_g1~~TRINITY_DN55234_c0_g1_i1.p1  ORF type:complete len:249 (-),score=22.57 TRINITY_DN55234_c0_g1_i1:202-885(-)